LHNHSPSSPLALSQTGARKPIHAHARPRSTLGIQIMRKRTWECKMQCGKIWLHAEICSENARKKHKIAWGLIGGRNFKILASVEWFPWRSQLNKLPASPDGERDGNSEQLSLFSQLRARHLVWVTPQKKWKCIFAYVYPRRIAAERARENISQHPHMYVHDKQVEVCGRN
jgi:hypothetical protein